jgi:nitrite reductase/ring-hydroxylating ferredoxin subunit
MSCKYQSRREFLQESGCGLFTLTAFGLAADTVLPVSAIAGTGADKERTYPIPAADGVNVDRGAQVMLVRYANRVYAFSMVCPHEHAAVKWLKKDNRFQCTKHDSQYKPDGTYTTGHATRNLDRFPIRREGASVVVDLQKVFQSDQHAAAWAAAAVDL